MRCGLLAAIAARHFNPQLAVNLMILELNGDYQELQRLLTRIIKWLEKTFKQRPKGHKRYKAALVYAHVVWQIPGW